MPVVPNGKHVVTTRGDFQHPRAMAQVADAIGIEIDSWDAFGELSAARNRDAHGIAAVSTGV
jgi:hypothetical protein